MKDNNDEKQLIEQKTQMYKMCFDGLNSEQKKLLAYKKVIELHERKNIELSVKSDEELSSSMDEIIPIIKAADYECGFFGPIVLNLMCNMTKKSKELYKESLVSYNKVLKNYQSLASELNITSSLELSHLFTYMLWNGYYSVSKKHIYKTKGRLLIPGMFSFDVIKGQGVCLAYASLLHDYLTVCDKISSVLECKVPTKKRVINCSYRPEIERNVENHFSSRISNKIFSPIIKAISNKTGNHAVTLIEENDKLYIYDSTNLYVLNITDNDIATIINGKGDFELKPFSTLMLNPDIKSIKIIAKLLFNNVEPAFDRKEIIFTFENIMELIQDNIKLLNDAYDNIHSELEFIEKQTNEFGGMRKIMKK